jgi:hypothetical protein
MSQNHQKIQIPRILNSLTPRFAHSEVTRDFVSLKYNWQIAVADMIICKTIKKNKPRRIILKETMPKKLLTILTDYMPEMLFVWGTFFPTWMVIGLGNDPMMVLFIMNASEPDILRDLTGLVDDVGIT